MNGDGEKISFEKATVEDVDQFVTLEKKVVGLKTYSGITGKEEAKTEIEQNEVYFIKKEDKVVGTTEYQIQGPDAAYLGGLVVDPEFWGQGIARQAIEFRLDKLRDIKRVWLVTHPHNSKIIRLYLSYSFIVEAWKDNYYGDGEPRLVLARERSI
ncbi:MAG: GNAT family N-acetyltransferase [Candidatus Brennerbacteria bacterium]|nr:GNAT family N-acetyltransferase [Candidatus Brennerbacteria bacterium]